MKTDLLMLVLCSGMESDRIDWTQSSSQCENINASLITLYDEDDVKFTGKITGGIYPLKREIPVWLGLSLSRSKGGTAEDPGDEQKCVAIHDNKTQCFKCMEQKFFKCNTSRESTLVNINMIWCQALQHCRQHYNTSLANFSSTAQIRHKHSFWIRERYDNWTWHDNGCSSFREWVTPEGGRCDDNCTVLDSKGSPDHTGLYKFQCRSQGDTFCSRGTVRIKVINDSKTWEDAYDYCKTNHTRLLWIRDENDQKAVEQWLNHTDNDIKFWIGLRQSRVFGFWIWSSDTTVWYDNWKDDKIPELPNSHHCGIIDKQDMKWSDEECTRELPFLCEEDIVYLD